MMGVHKLQYLEGDQHPDFDWRRWLGTLTQTTALAYRKDLRYFSAWHIGVKLMDVSVFGIDESVRDLINSTSQDASVLVNGYRTAMLGEGLAGNTVKRRLATLRSLVKQAGTGVVLSVARVRSANIKDTRGPTLEEGRAILRLVQERNFQDYLAISMIMTMGLRSAELLGILKADVDLSRGTLTIKRKAYCDKRHLSIPSHLVALITEQTETFQGMKLFSYSTSGLYRMCKSYGFNPHAFRHFAATVAMHNGRNITDLMVFMNHSDPKTTARYVDQHDDVVKAIAEEIWETINE